jgi:hypothetical protein
MKNSIPSSKAILSAIAGILAATLVIGTVLVGGSIVNSLRGDALQASHTARSTFAIAGAGSTTVLKAPRIARTTTARPTTQITYRVAGFRAGDGESQED